ncbi:MAG: hypothetical protein V1914_03470 [archaeon]
MADTRTSAQASGMASSSRGSRTAQNIHSNNPAAKNQTRNNGILDKTKHAA